MNTGVGAWTRPTHAGPDSDGDAARGWYLYGIARRGSLAAVLADAPDESPYTALPDAVPGGIAPLQLLEDSGLVAVVSSVLLSDFSPAVIEERLRSVGELEAMVRSHHHVIEAVHARQAILPAKFGTVYTHAEDIVAALRSARDTLLRQLDGLEGCDEWAVHLYADQAVVRDSISATDPAIQRLREECARARPGRAYFLARQLQDELEAATRNALTTLAQRSFDRLRGVAVAGQVSAAAPGGDPAGEVEILRAAFLVARGDAEPFETELYSFGSGSEGLRAECTGPWPPYSFAAYDEKAE